MTVYHNGTSAEANRNKSRMHQHAVTVVLATHKDSEFLGLSVESVLAQKGIELELIVVGDGAPEDVESRLKAFKDKRIRYITLPKGGLTKALIAGCEAALNQYIARLDVGDFMLSGRVARQAEVLSRQPTVGLVSSNFAMYTAEGYYLYNTDYDTESLVTSLTQGNELQFRSPMHASVMFRKDLYFDVGGYRQEFYFAQDCDLWTRMLEHSGFRNLDEVLSGGIFDTSGISGQYQTQQARFKKMVIELRDRRKQNNETESVLSVARKLSDEISLIFSRQPKNAELDGQLNTSLLNKNTAASDFFIARCLMSQDSKQAHHYWRRFLSHSP